MKTVIGKRAVKINSTIGDAHSNNAKCYIIGKNKPMEGTSEDTTMYLALFDDFPLPVAVHSSRVSILAKMDSKQIKLSPDQEQYIDQVDFMFSVDYEKKEKE